MGYLLQLCPLDGLVLEKCNLLGMLFVSIWPLDWNGSQIVKKPCREGGTRPSRGQLCLRCVSLDFWHIRWISIPLHQPKFETNPYFTLVLSLMLFSNQVHGKSYVQFGFQGSWNVPYIMWAHQVGSLSCQLTNLGRTDRNGRQDSSSKFGRVKSKT